MTTTFCSTRRGHGEEERAGVFVCVCLTLLSEMVDGCIKETEDIQLIKPK